ncbi:PREDICTED: cysteine-rich receptor-like protein kinase 29 [Tarenaya hassleriana]|uniref:cysteine-rich receptor-like protein kinase 29 n=1 Tax=Tarenaya hassleriana TaxID=28532 RepID=UPI0008FCEFF8|nr:PREDICTED: cysteine-rich receptor-like protein kinase 29 [Tarenaya hassleriana]
MGQDKTGSLSPPRRVMFFSIVLTLLPFRAVAQADRYEFPPRFFCLSRGGNFTANSTFAANLNHLVPSLSSLSPSPYGFYNVSVGNPSEESANAIALCRREVRREDCLSCVQKAARTLTEQCPWRKEAVIWYTHCMFRYSNASSLGFSVRTPNFAFISGKEISGNKDEFVRLQTELLNRLKDIAAAGGPNRKYAQGEGNGSASSGFNRFYGSAQCTPDLSEFECDSCLVSGFQNIQQCCDGQTGMRWFCPTCNFRFETSRFYELESNLEPDPPSPSPSNQTPAKQPATSNKTTEKGKGSSRILVAILVPVAFVTVIVACICLFLKRKKKKAPGVRTEDAEDELAKRESLQLDFETLKAATDNFSPDNELGRGGFGSVYKGVLSNGQEIAVKRLSGNSGQGDGEFKNEVLLVLRLQHRNLVRLLGFCLEGQERILVYEFIKNASLDHFLFDPERRRLLDWVLRYKMIGGIARGLLYLHEDSRYRIIHRDLKASNILLDEEMNPKIADFGLAKLFDTDQTTHRFTNRIAGTYGYMAPEYAMHGQISAKTDVFSFGVLVLEIISGKRNNEPQDGECPEYLLTYAWRNWREDSAFDIIDPSLAKTGPRNEILRCIHIGLLCVEENSVNRPTMASVVLMLSSSSFTLPMPSRPAFVVVGNAAWSDNLSYSDRDNSITTGSTASRTEILPLSLNGGDASYTQLSPR